MGSSGSKLQLCKVAPYKSQCEEWPRQSAQPKLYGSFFPLPANQRQQPRYMEQKRTVLPPLKQEIKPEPYFPGTSKQNDNLSIIHSHPPRRPPSMVHSDEGAHWFSAAAGTRQPGTARPIQGRFLDAQTDLTQKAYRCRRGHLRQAREQRRHKVFCSVNESNGEVNLPLKLVTRPTQRDIFWDSTTGEHLDSSCRLESHDLLTRQRQYFFKESSSGAK